MAVRRPRPVARRVPRRRPRHREAQLDLSLDRSGGDRRQQEREGAAGAEAHGPGQPVVWSGRALQEVFIDLAVSGLASMYPALDWSALCSWPSWISARVRSHSRISLDRAI